MLPGGSDIDTLVLGDHLDANEGALQSHSGAIPVNIIAARDDALLRPL
jgi:hypothetical protein